MDGLIKVTSVTTRSGVYESLWAEPVRDGVAILRNIPFDRDDIGFLDVVKYDERRNITSLVEKRTRTVRCKYEPTHVETMDAENASQFSEYVREQESDITIQFVQPGYVLLAVPIDVPQEKLDAIIENAPLCVTVLPEIDDEV